MVGVERWLADHRPDVLVTVGAFGVSRPVLGLAELAKCHVSVRRALLPADPGRTADVVVDELPFAVDHPAGPWLAGWQEASSAVGAAVAATLAGERLTGLSVAADVWDLAPPGAPILVAASWSLRAVEAVAGVRAGTPALFCNRGTNGIDGLIATSMGIALGTARPTTALLGDLAFLYDVTSLIAPAGEAVPDLVIVVVNNDGGGIFHQLEQGRPEHSEHFERVFGTAPERDLVAISAAFDVPSQQVSTRGQLRSALAVARAVGGVQVIVARVGGRPAEWLAWQGLFSAAANAV